MKLYAELAGWYRLIDPPPDHADEAGAYGDLLARAAPGARTLLELGCGGGHNASYLKARFECTLTDLSPVMLALSRELNPECAHVLGDMRTLRLGRSFDLVLVHDAVMYMTTREDVLAAARTAFAHLRPAGAALFVPDCVRETFREGAHMEGSDLGARSARFIEWSRDPDPDDETCTVDYAFLLRDGTEVQAVHDRHVEGLFAEAVWVEVLARAGFDVAPVHGALEDEPGVVAVLCRRP